MKRYILATMSAAAMLAMPLVAAAEDDYGGQPKSHEQMEHERTGSFQNKQIIMGEVTELDKQTNEVTIRTQEGEELKLSFPASALTNIKQGDRVAVEMALRPVQPGMEQQQTPRGGQQQPSPGAQP